MRRRWPESIAIPAAIIREPLSPLALRLWLLLAKWQVAFPSNDHLLEWLPPGTDASSLRRAKRELKEANLLKVERRFREDGQETSSLYELLHPDDREEGEITPLPLGETARLQEDENAPPRKGETALPNSKEGTSKEPPTPTDVGARSINPRALGASPRQLGTSPRQIARAEQKLAHEFRMARTIGESFATVVDDPSGVGIEILHQLGEHVGQDIIKAGIDAWTARREEISA